jgi:hypothetical protein
MHAPGWKWTYFMSSDARVVGPISRETSELGLLREKLRAEFGSPRLTLELVPRSSWYSNVRSHVSESAWDRLRGTAYKRAGQRCEVCGGRGATHPVECHELWEYDDAAGLQKLLGLIALCPACHSVKHLGRSHVVGRGDDAVGQLMSVNDWTWEHAEAYIDIVLKIWKLRSRAPWRLDLSWLEAQKVMTRDA